MEVRTMRVRIAASAPPMVIAGRSKCAKVPEPDTGSHPSLMENNKIRIGPSAKFGKESPNKLTTLRARSSHEFRRRAERTPAGMDSNIATSKAAKVNCKVYG